MKGIKVLFGLFLLCFMGLTAIGQKKYQFYESKMKSEPQRYLDSLKQIEADWNRDSILWYRALLYDQLTDRNNALINYRLSLDRALHQNDTIRVLRSFIKLAWLRFGMGDYNRAHDYYRRAYRYIEHGDDCSRQLTFLHSMAIMQSYLKNETAFARQLKKVVNKAEECGDLSVLSKTYKSLGVHYTQRNKADSALLYFEKSEKILQKLGDSLVLAHAYALMGDVYYNVRKDKKEALNYYLKSDELYTLKKEASRAFLDIKLGTYYIENGQPALAKKYAESAYRFYQQTGIMDGLSRSTSLLASIAYHMKDPEGMRRYYEEHEKVRDSVFKLEAANTYATNQLRFEMEAKDLELAREKLHLQSERRKSAELQLKDERKRFWLILLFGLLVVGGLGIFFYSRSRRNRSELRFQRSLAQERKLGIQSVINAQEQERERIGRDLHDGVCQSLSALRLEQLHLIGEEESEPEAWSKSIKRLEGIYEEVRRLSHLYTPELLEKVSLEEAIEENLINTFGKQGIRYEFESNLEPGLIIPPLVRTNLYRIIQELIQNVIKHAQADFVKMQLYKRGDRLLFVMEDNGKGFDPAEQSGGIGWKNIRTRTDLLQGSVELESQAGKGCFVCVQFSC
ncbi:MAG: hypothetical protein EP338_07450 [Bacteroidetes bacterium]|nr:MAG: hypothetical protein EP338_07450 [Bacteroidota bacterium]